MTVTPEEIEAGIRRIAATHLNISDDVRREARLVEDLGLDSLQLLTLSFEIENHFEIILEPEDERAIVTVQDLAEAIARLLDDDPRP